MATQEHRDDPAARIAELEARNRELQRTAHLHRILLESVIDYAIFTLDTDLRVTGWNSGGQRLLGWAADEILGRPGEILFVPEDRARSVPATEAQIAMAEGRATNERWHLRKDGSRFWGAGLTMPLRDGNRLEGFIKIMRDQTERRRTEQTRKLLLGELSHRVKNTLALVQALAEQTLKHTPDPAAFADSYRERLIALSRAHDVLTREVWERASIADVVDTAIGAWMSGGRVTVQGPEVWLNPQQAMTFSLAMHELATNAAKYGALSTPEGRVAISWRGEDEIVLEWIETGGPAVTPPSRRGFGSVILTQALRAAVHGDVQLDFKPGGLHLQMRFKRPDLAATRLDVDETGRA
ncbi:sensor histidine kinase [Dongia deserti]|uniref:sensor histidine kinase n=1 Tax=Dongia deserti TaxID=2268030 RepID=UPI000E6535DB|nr:HWE histidine kinase domain-containing protein [Dongia deserti]